MTRLSKRDRSISQTALLLGVCTQTTRRWDKTKQIKCIRTVGGHRRIHITEITHIIKGKKRRYIKKERGVATYARVSSYEQKKKGNLVLCFYNSNYKLYDDT